MRVLRRRRLMFYSLMGAVLSLVVLLVLYALRQNISLFYTPTQLVNGEAAKERLIRVGGMVVKQSVVHSDKDLFVQFQLTDFKHTVTVNYRGILPDLFREGQGIVAAGHTIDKTHFLATEVLAKHDANYMPPEVKASLKAQGKK